jgi:hypothetical protein
MTFNESVVINYQYQQGSMMEDALADVIDDVYTDVNDTKYKAERHAPPNFFVSGDDVSTPRPTWATLMLTGLSAGSLGAVRELEGMSGSTTPPTLVIHNNGKAIIVGSSFGAPQCHHV